MTDAPKHRRTGALLMLATTLWCVSASVRPCVAQDIRPRLESRGLPADLVDQVTAVAAEATAQGLPAAPLADKAIEGYAKSVPAPRIIAALRQYSARMADGRNAVRDAGVAEPQGHLIAAAADALGRGLVAAQVGRVVRAAPQADLATPGLTVLAALAAQGIPTQTATEVVAQAMQRGNNAAQILDLPSVARAMQSRGMSPDDAGQAILHGGREPRGGRPDRPAGAEGPPGPGRGPGAGATPPRPPDGTGRGPGPGTRPPGDGSGTGARPPRP